MNTLLTTAILYLLSPTIGPAVVNAQVAEICESELTYKYDSGKTNTASTIVQHAGAPWIQLDLTYTDLASNAKLVITGPNSSSSETLTADTLANNGWSAVFDGDSVKVELVTRGKNFFRGSKGKGDPSRVVVSAIKAGVCDSDVIASSICGANDDRIPSTDVRAGRIGGCTGWLISEDVFLQAGHCGTPGASTRMHFTYGTGSAAAEDQYAIVPGSYKSSDDYDGGTRYGHDFGIGRLSPNSVTGKLPGIAQGGWYGLGPVPSSTEGVTMRVTGYGTATVDSRSQKTHTGGLAQITGSGESWYIKYTMDTTGGNSGSPAIHEETGNAIGIHTHGGCNGNGGGANSGTRIDHPRLAPLIEFYLKACSADSDCSDSQVSNGLETCINGKCQYGEAPTMAPVQCSGGVYLTVDIKTDNYPGETSYTLTDKCKQQQIDTKSAGSFTAANTLYTTSYCVDPNSAFDFTINDSYGDGMCCSYGAGSYTVTYDGIEYTSPTSGTYGGSETIPISTCGGIVSPTPLPTTAPTTNAPSPPPTTSPTWAPTTLSPTAAPTNNAPALSPTSSPFQAPTRSPTSTPTTNAPTPPPTTSSPITAPTTNAPSLPPTSSPTSAPTTLSPTSAPTTNAPTPLPTTTPSTYPTTAPTTNAPSPPPTTSSPTTAPTTNAPSLPPTSSPTSAPTTSSPTSTPTTNAPTPPPTTTPSTSPSMAPITNAPSPSPSSSPTSAPTTISPTSTTTTNAPTPPPDAAPTNPITPAPTNPLTPAPTNAPTDGPTLQPTTPGPTPCTGAEITVDVLTDNWPQETDWTLTNTCNGAQINSPASLARSTQYLNNYCLPAAQYTFEITDTYGDGICCSYGQGSVSVVYNGNPVLNVGAFGSSTSETFGTCGSNATPPPTPSTLPATIATFNSGLAVPKCSGITAACTSGLVLISGTRGNQEPNPSNTLDGCIDGANGVYHSDESVDQITVSAIGGGLLQAGTLAEIEAKVWAWSDGSQDMVDFYYSANVDNLEWKLIGSRPAGGSGERTLKIQYTTPLNSPLQAVRVSIRYQGSLDECPGGGWDESDDLVFTVDPTPASFAAAVGAQATIHVPPPKAMDPSHCAEIGKKDRKRCEEGTLCIWKGGRNKGCYPNTRGYTAKGKATKVSKSDDHAAQKKQQNHS